LVLKEDLINLGTKDGAGNATFPNLFREQNIGLKNMVTWLNEYNGTACNVEPNPSAKWYKEYAVQYYNNWL
jgi:hypothetical protein